MAPAHIPVFLSQKSSTKNGIILPAILFLAWIGRGRAVGAGPRAGAAMAECRLEEGAEMGGDDRERERESTLLDHATRSSRLS